MESYGQHHICIHRHTHAPPHTQTHILEWSKVMACAQNAVCKKMGVLFENMIRKSAVYIYIHI